MSALLIRPDKKSEEEEKLRLLQRYFLLFSSWKRSRASFLFISIKFCVCVFLLGNVIARPFLLFSSNSFARGFVLYFFLSRRCSRFTLCAWMDGRIDWLHALLLVTKNREEIHHEVDEWLMFWLYFIHQFLSFLCRAVNIQFHLDKVWSRVRIRSL